jgi:hypothetical protein
MRSPRPAQFLFVLHYFKENGVGEVTKPLLLGHIKAPGDRKTIDRLIEWIDDNGLRDHVHYETQTEGPWSINPDSPIQVTFKLDGRDVPSAQIFERFFKPKKATGFVAGLGADPNPLSNAAIHIAYGDRQFGRGALKEAWGQYDKAFAEADENSEPLMLAVAAQRLLQVYRRTENYGEIPRLRSRVEAFASQISAPHIRRFLARAAELYSVWYLYSGTKDYANADERLEKISLKDIDVPNLRIEWSNLRGLIDRRLCLQALDAKNETEAEARLASSLAHLRAALHEAILFNIPYHIQQAAANYANVLALYRTRAPHLLPESEDEIRAQVLRLLSFSNVVAELFQLGKDDMYNPIYLLSIARRFNLTASDLERLWRANLWPVSERPMGVSSLAKGLAAYGDSEFQRVGDGNRTFGPEQQALLAYEICAAAITEEQFELYKRYVKVFVDRAWSDQDSPSPDAIGRAASLNSHQIEKRNHANWHKASDPLKELIEASK